MKIKLIGAIALGVSVLFAAYLIITVLRLPSVAGLADSRMNLTIQVEDCIVDPGSRTIV